MSRFGLALTTNLSSETSLLLMKTITERAQERRKMRGRISQAWLGLTCGTPELMIEWWNYCLPVSWKKGWSPGICPVQPQLLSWKTWRRPYKEKFSPSWEFEKFSSLNEIQIFIQRYLSCLITLVLMVRKLFEMYVEQNVKLSMNKQLPNWLCLFFKLKVKSLGNLLSKLKWNPYYAAFIIQNFSQITFFLDVYTFCPTFFINSTLYLEYRP